MCMSLVNIERISPSKWRPRHRGEANGFLVKNGMKTIMKNGMKTGMKTVMKKNEKK